MHPAFFMGEMFLWMKMYQIISIGGLYVKFVS